MKTFSKVLTLNKLHIIENIIDTANLGSVKADYFNIGNPIDNPPSLRGSIVILLNLSFLTDNKQFFKIGSPIDTGSIKFGFLKPDIENELFFEMITCDYIKFYSLTLDLFSLPSSSLDNLNSHRECTSFKPVLDKYFSTTVINFMYREKDPHAWLFEFCLDTGYILKKNHIDKIFIPNTYISNPMIKKLKNILKDKVVKYNPKYGIEGREY